VPGRLEPVERAQQHAQRRQRLLHHHPRNVVGGRLVAGHTYDITRVAPSTDFVAWSEAEGGAIAAVLNLDDRTVYTSAVFPSQSRFLMHGVLESVSDTEGTPAP